MLTQTTKAVSFAALHAQADAFIIPNPWDVGTARLLATLGFEALATTSAGYAFSAGRPDNVVTRDETIAHAASIASATDLPVSADLENGFGDDPGSVAETIRLAAAAGVSAVRSRTPRHARMGSRTTSPWRQTGSAPPGKRRMDCHFDSC